MVIISVALAGNAGMKSNSTGTTPGSAPSQADAASARRLVTQRVQDVLGTAMGRESEETSSAIVYLVRFLVGGKPMPMYVELRWRALGVLTDDGTPNLAMKCWANHLLTGEESDGALRGILFILETVYEEGPAFDSQVNEKVGIPT